MATESYTPIVNVVLKKRSSHQRSCEQEERLRPFEQFGFDWEILWRLLGVGRTALCGGFFILLLHGCAPAPVTRDQAYGVWQGHELPAKTRIQITFIAPNKVEVLRPDKGEQVERAEWRIDSGSLFVDREEGSWMFTLGSEDVQGEPRLALREKEGKLSVTKL
jgi:hypothetical protein